MAGFYGYDKLMRTLYEARDRLNTLIDLAEGSEKDLSKFYTKKMSKPGRRARIAFLDVSRDALSIRKDLMMIYKMRKMTKSE